MENCDFVSICLCLYPSKPPSKCSKQTKRVLLQMQAKRMWRASVWQDWGCNKGCKCAGEKRAIYTIRFKKQPGDQTFSQKKGLLKFQGGVYMNTIQTLNLFKPPWPVSVKLKTKSMFLVFFRLQFRYSNFSIYSMLCFVCHLFVIRTYGRDCPLNCAIYYQFRDSVTRPLLI